MAMRTSMAFPIRFWAILLACLLILQFSTEASADWCKYENDINLTLDVSDSDVLAIAAVAGDLEITGVPGTSEAVIHGKVCASKESWLENASIETQGGERAQINVLLPKTDNDWSLSISNYLSIDLRIEVPEDLLLDVKDSSGDMLLNNIAGGQLQDSSGDIEINDANGAIVLKDSSGDIDIDQLNGDLTVESDSSGDIYAKNIQGEVLVKRDSSGDIRVAHVSDSVIVERDSSGDIRADDVGGDFRVYKDGSGGIHSSDIKGETEIPSKS
jgi:hypothetical protein